MFFFAVLLVVLFLYPGLGMCGWFGTGFVGGFWFNMRYVYAALLLFLSHHFLYLTLSFG